MSEREAILGWHFIRPDMKTAMMGLPVVVGEVLSVEGEILPCHNGLHASMVLEDAMGYAEFAMLCRVRSWGDVEWDSDKYASRHRRCLWALDVEKFFVEYTCSEFEALINRAVELDVYVHPDTRKSVEAFRLFHNNVLDRDGFLLARQRAFQVDPVYNPDHIVSVVARAGREILDTHPIDSACAILRAKDRFAALINRPQRANAELETAVIEYAKSQGIQVDE